MTNEEATPAEKAPASTPRFRYGDRVKIRYSKYRGARIVELWGPLGPGGTQVYRIRIPVKPKPIYIDVREDQLTLIPPKEQNPPHLPGGSQAGSNGVSG